MTMSPCVMHVDIDAFFASVEQARNPALRGRPVIVGAGVIASCSYEARRYGLRAGMPLRTAKRLCPNAVVLEGHHPTYRCFSDRVFEACREIAPDIETYLDEAYCDISGTERLYGKPAEAGKLLRARIKERTSLSVTVGIGTNRMIAKMAGSSVKPDGLARVPPGEENEFVRELPIDKLPGVGHATEKVLRKLNIATIGELRLLSADSLQALFGAHGLALYERCRGRDSFAVSEREIPRSISRETTFHRDTIDTDEIEGMLFYLTERATSAMRQLGLRCRTVSVRIRYSDFSGESRARSLAPPTEIDKEIFELGLKVLRSIYTKRVSLRYVGVTLSNFSLRRDHQPVLFDEKRKTKLLRLCRCVDELRARFGYSVVTVGRSLELLNRLERDDYGFILRTPSLTK